MSLLSELFRRNKPQPSEINGEVDLRRAYQDLGGDERYGSFANFVNRANNMTATGGSIKITPGRTLRFQLPGPRAKINYPPETEEES